MKDFNIISKIFRELKTKDCNAAFKSGERGRAVREKHVTPCNNKRTMLFIIQRKI